MKQACLALALLLVGATGGWSETLTGQMIFNSKDAKVMALSTPAGLVALAHGPNMTVTGIESLDGLKSCDQVDIEATASGKSRVIGLVAFRKRDEGATCPLPEAPTVSVAEFNEALAGKSAFVIDVRTADEYGKAHFAGAVNIPLTEIEARRSELPREKPAILYCATARRATFAALLLKEKGIETKIVKGKFVVKDGTLLIEQ